jgi:predicted alpha/beta superfamily hydrolase
MWSSPIPSFLLALLLCLGGPINAQDITVKIGITDSVRSERLNETRALIVYLPTAYESSDKLYPVLYLLDGSRGEMLRALASISDLRSNDYIPETIIVAIANVDRDRDMMPPSTELVVHEYSVVHHSAVCLPYTHC